MARCLGWPTQTKDSEAQSSRDTDEIERFSMGGREHVVSHEMSTELMLEPL